LAARNDVPEVEAKEDLADLHHIIGYNKPKDIAYGTYLVIKDFNKVTFYLEP